MRNIIKHADWALFLLLVAIFVTMPTLDLAVSAWFYDVKTASWPLANDPVLAVIYTIFHKAPVVLIPLLLIMLAWTGYKLGFKAWKTRASVFLLLTLLIGPGILVHTVFKEGFERPRPRQVQEFGGNETFTPAFIVNDTCSRSCKSFVSGHAAMGLWFMAFAWLLRRRRYFWIGLGIGVVASAGRILQGGHFLSDTIFAGFICYFVYRGLSYWLLGYSRISEEPVQVPSLDPLQPEAQPVLSSESNATPAP